MITAISQNRFVAPQRQAFGRKPLEEPLEKLIVKGNEASKINTTKIAPAITDKLQLNTKIATKNIKHDK